MSEGRTIQRVGVVGAGTMGNGIAHVFSMAGLDVLLVDVDAGVLEGAIGTIKRNLQRQVKKEKISAGDAEGALALIRTTTDPAGLNDAQLVVEAVSLQFICCCFNIFYIKPNYSRVFGTILFFSFTYSVRFDHEISPTKVKTS